MISRKELNPHGYKLTDEQEKNQEILHVSINVIRGAWAKPMTITSGVRSAEDQAKINPSAPKSKHLVGAACDIQDKDGKLYKWCKNNHDKLEKANLFCEEGTLGWVHFQCLPFGSYKPGGTRWFKP